MFLEITIAKNYFWQPRRKLAKFKKKVWLHSYQDLAFSNITRLLNITKLAENMQMMNWKSL